MISEESETDTLRLPFNGESAPLGRTSVIVDDVHVTYRVFGGRRGGTVDSRPSLLQRAISIGRPSGGPISEVKAVRGVSFVARHGESIGIIGTNGSGKSTLLRTIAGLIPPSKGRVFTTSEPALLGVNAALMPKLTGERNILVGGLAMGLDADEVRERTSEVAEFAELGDFLYMPMNSYSSGMGSRLRFAISTIVTPDVLMIDEALSTGDASFKKKSTDRIREVRDNAGTVFFVSHSLNSVRSMCNRAIWIDQGMAVMDGAVDTVADAYQRFIDTRKDSTSGASL